MGVKHSRKGVKHPSRVKILLETPWTQMCGLPSQLRIRMVLMAADTIALVMQYCNRAPPLGGCPRLLALVHMAWMCLIILRQRPIPGGPAIPNSSYEVASFQKCDRLPK
jgi:hypothetical protein